MIEFPEIFAELKNKLKQHAAAGLIDEVDAYNNYLAIIKQFGALPMEDFEDVIEIKNGTGKLPEGFRKLILALKCEPYTYKTKYKDHLQESRFWRERHEKTATWDSCNDCCVEEGEKYIVEKVYFREYEADYYYKGPEVLTLVKGVNKAYCTADCFNLKIHSSPYEINIVKGNILQTNFTKGSVFIKYKGYSTDEEGFITIPDTNNGHLRSYIINELIKQTMISIIAGGDATSGEANIMSLFAQLSMDSKTLAMSELKASSFSPSAIKKLKNRMKREHSKFSFIR